MTDLPNLRELLLRDGDVDLDDVGGSGGVRVVAFDFAFDTADLNAGVSVYTPAVGDVLLDAWILVTEAFNGTTPLADIGTFVGNAHGLFFNNGLGPPSIANADTETPGGASGLLNIATDTNRSLVANAAASGDVWAVQCIATATNPIKLVVSQDGAAAGAAIGGTTGAGRLYLLLATPSS